MNIDNIIKSMTLEEKVGQLNQKLYGWEVYEKIGGQIKLTNKFKEHAKKYNYSIGAIYGILRADPWSGKDFESGLTLEESKYVLNLVSDYLNDKSTHKIRPFIVEETPHGHQGLNSYLLPPNISVGATFNSKLYNKAVNVVANDMEALGVDIGLFVGLDIAKDQRWGRVEETFGEDPYLAAMLTKEIVRATQKYRFSPCLKHFAAQGAPYLGLNSGAVSIGEREFREIHLLPMKEASKLNVKMIMAAYNEIDGVPCHANKKLLTTILRDELGFDGVVMADGLAIDRLISKSQSIEVAGKIALEAGVNLSLWDRTYDNLILAVKKGIVSEKLLDESVKKILQLKEQMGLIEEEFKVIKFKDIDSHKKYSLQLAQESIILEKNVNKYLPFSKKSKILIIGNNALDLYAMLGDYTPIQQENKYFSLFEALKAKFSSVTYMNYNDFLEEKLIKKVFNKKIYDKIIVVMGGSSRRDFGSVFDDNGAIVSNENLVTDCGENVDVSSIALKDVQKKVAQKLYDNNLDFLTLIIAGRAYALEGIDDISTAILQAYYPGVYGADALSDIISGEINPSGKNPLTILKSQAYNQYTYNSKQDFRKDDYSDQKDIVAYPFGYGLSYSEFKYSKFKVDLGDENINIQVEVKNISNIVGKEVVQIYVKKENTVITKRRRELIAFKKISIKADEKVIVNFKIPYDQLNIYDLNFKEIFENNIYTFIVGDGENSYFEKEVKIIRK